MKKILFILPVVLLTLGMMSCRNKSNDPEVKGKDFKIKVTEITATTANIAILPSDTTATYYVGIEPSENLSASVLNIDSLSEAADWYIQFIIAYGEAFGEKYTYEDFLYQGKIEGKDGAVEELFPETEYIVYAFKLDNTGKASGELAYVTFKTKEVVPEKKETLNLTNAMLYDATEEGYWELLAAPKDSSIILYMSPEEAETLDGTYSTADLSYYSWLYVAGAKNELSLIKADVKVATKGKKATITGMIVSSDMTQYDLDISADIEVELFDDDDWGGFFAPVRKKAESGKLKVEKGKLKVGNGKLKIER